MEKLMEKKEKIEFYFKVLQRFDQYIQLANTNVINLSFFSDSELYSLRP